MNESVQATEAPSEIIVEIPEEDSSALPETATLTGDFSAKYADKFITGDPQITDTSYISENVNISIQTYREQHVDFYVTDIYVRDISCFRRIFANDEFGKNLSESIGTAADRNSAIITINGDYYGTRENGVVEANGTLYLNEKVYNDICVMYWDGTMQCFSKDDFSCDREIANNAYQIWNFGPSLLDSDGHAIDEFPSRYDDIKKHNPRSAIGYYEPGHYCFICADGRSSESDGLTMSELSLLCEKLGLRQAYNMDGGKTAQLYFNGSMVNNPSSGGRECSDFVSIIDSVVR